MNEETLFHLALEKPAGERSAFLDHACAGNAALRRRVEALLWAHDNPGSFLAQPAVGLATSDTSCEAAGDSALSDAAGSKGPPLVEGPGSRVGPYRLLQQLGEGGMGAVFLAEQDQPVQRQVALKIIKPGMDSRQVVARFEAERQALALMDHQHIARVFDAGTTASGRPYFVMELVRGVSLTRYCDEHRLTPRERLELFLPVCRAVQHAHQKGIIHRDLKPTNVLVALCDGRPVPKVIDFGVAKAVGLKLTQETLYTEYGQVVGTLEYMSPEQAELNNLDIDTRSDIYSLGVLLYELLTGTTPLERKRLREYSLIETLRAIREEEPPKPSSRLRAAADLPRLAASRGLEPKQLCEQVQGDLDWIVMKCLEKERSRRYDTANGLALDLQRYLHDEPVGAGPPSASYKLRKFLRRHRGAVAAAAAVLVTLLAGVGVSTWQAVQATAERNRALEAEAGERQAAADAREAAQVAQAINSFLLNDLIAAARPRGQGLGKDVTLKQALDEAEPKIREAFVNQPLAERPLRDTLGESYFRLGHYQEALTQYERAVELGTRWLGPDRPETVASLNNLGMCYRALGRLPDAERIYGEALERLERTVGPDHRETLSAMSNLGLVLKMQNKLREAETLYQRSLEGRRKLLGPDDADTLQGQHNLAALLQTQGRREEAVALFRATYEARQRVLGPEHPSTLSTQNGLAGILRVLKRHAESEPHYRHVLEARRRILGDDHADTLTSVHNLAGCLHDRNCLDEAATLARTALEGRRRIFPAGHHYIGHSLQALATVFHTQGRYAEAEPLCREALAIFQRALPRDHPMTAATQGDLGRCLLAQKKHEEAEMHLLAAQAVLSQARTARDRAEQRQVMEALIQLYDAWGKPDQAAEWRARLPSRKLETEEP